jgi:xylulokinase
VIFLKNDQLILGVDVGTSGLKVMICDVEGNIIGTQSEKYEAEYPRPGWAEQDPLVWESAFIKSTNTLVSKLGHDIINSIEGICVSSQIDGLITINKEGKPLHKAIIWIDRRATKQVEEIKKLIDYKDFYKITGLVIDPSHPAAKILWLKDNRKDLYNDAWKFLSPNDYMIYFLTGNASTDYTNASTTMLFDIKNRKWSEEICEALAIDISKLPDIKSSIHIAGDLLENVAHKAGLRAGIPVVMGGGDEEVGAVGAGVISEGSVLDIIGTAEPIVAPVNSPVLDPSMTLELHAHACPDKWLLENTGILSGGIYSHFLKNFCLDRVMESTKSGASPYDLMNSEAESTEPGSGGLLFLPFCSGSITPEWNPEAKGVFIGITPYHNRGHFIRAIIEGTAFVVRDVVEKLSNIGLKINNLVVAGGGSRGKIWLETRANITGITVKSPIVEDVTPYGACLLGMVGIGIEKNLEKLISRVIKYRELLMPEKRLYKFYSEIHKIYLEAYYSLKNVFSRLALSSSIY